jgi:GntR family transcriptional regulator / MocR family aminotransferase
MYGLHVDHQSLLSITRQLTGQLRTMILNGTLPAGTRLPPTRSLSMELNISRNTVLQVYEQLIAEGYLSGRTGSGTYVIALSQPGAAPVLEAPKRHAAGKNDIAEQEGMIAFEAGLTDARHFPRAAWMRAMRDAVIDMPEEGFAFSASCGEEELRRELCAYLYRTKDITCSPEQIFILPGATSGVDAACWALKSCPVAAMEDPCVHFMRQAFLRNGYEIVPIPVDSQGMKTDQLAVLNEIGFIYAVPSHQFPTGSVLPIRRRLELLSHARRTGAYIIEDDYDSEFRYEGEPIQTLRHLDPERVVYLGSFSKIFSPTLRMGYMILPWEAIDKMRFAMESINLSVPVLLQHALAFFLHSGQLEHHIYKMRRLYAKKRLLLIRELKRAFGAKIRISGENAGMHLMVAFENHPLCREDFDRLHACRVEVEWSEDYAVQKGMYESGMILGYGALSEEEIKTGVARLRTALIDM